MTALPAADIRSHPGLPGRIRVALAGNPNTGKTSLFNAMTGARQHVGNWPGVTVEKKEGSRVWGKTVLSVTDLPGAYSLSPFSLEEKVARDELLSGCYDAIIVSADSSNLGRSLVILAQIMMTGTPCVLCLNMWDEAERAGKRIDIHQMEVLLGIPVLKTVGRTGIGVDALPAAVERAIAGGDPGAKLVLGERLERAIGEIESALSPLERSRKDALWIALEYLSNESTAHNTVGEIAAEARRRIEGETGLDIQTVISESFFGFVDGLLREVTKRDIRPDARAVSDRIDRVVVHRMLGLPLFALVMYSIFFVTFSVGEMPMGWIEAGFEGLAGAVSALWPMGSDSALRALIVEGIIGGVGGVLVFLPNILLLFLGLAFLEDTGYMARAAFIMDRVMHRFGLHGKSFLPLLTGFGCSIPGIMATRTLENHRDRMVTMLVLPLISCGARLPIWMLLIPAFFPPLWRAPVLFAIYGVGVAAALLFALLLRRTVFKGEDAPFVMELPPYRLPTLKAVTGKMAERSWLYLKKAGTVILAVSVLMWFAAEYPSLDESAVSKIRANAALQGLSDAEVDAVVAAEALQHAAAGRVGRWMEPVLSPLGFDWKIGCALVGAFAAKEVFVAQMGVVYAMGETDETSVPLREALAADYTPLIGLSMMLFLLIGTPCMATAAVVRRETGTAKWAAFQFFGLTIIAWIVSFLVYQSGRLMGWG